MAKKKTRGELQRELNNYEDLLTFYEVRLARHRWAYSNIYRDFITTHVKKEKSHYSLMDLARRFFSQKVVETKKSISKTKTSINTLKSASIRKHKEKSLAELIIEGSDIPITERRFCSARGRELEVCTKMFKYTDHPTSRNWQGQPHQVKTVVEPKTPAQIGLHRLQGYMFDGEFSRYTKASASYTWGRGINGLYHRAEKYSSDQDLVNKATEHRKKIKDVVNAWYIGGNGDLRPLKLDQVFVLSEKAPSKVNKWADFQKKFDEFFNCMDYTHRCKIIRVYSIKNAKNRKRFLTRSEFYGNLWQEFLSKQKDNGENSE